MREYISLEDFAEEVGLPVADDAVTDPETGARMTSRGIRTASRAVEMYLVSVLYLTDADGYPADADLRSLFHDATLEQCLALWGAEKLLRRASASSPLGRPLQSASIGSASYTADSGQSGVESGLELPRDGSLCVSAVNILDYARLPKSVTVYG